jgi:hypothetical protein
MNNIQNRIGLMVVLSQLTHIFCCGLPFLFSILSLLSSLGLIGVIPVSFSSTMTGFHEVLHVWELPILLLSAIILSIGWWLDLYSRKLDCSTTSSCSHKPCGTKKKKSTYMLIVASAIFAINLITYAYLAH